MQTAARLADGLIFNSQATAAQFAPFLARLGRSPRSVVAPLGLDLPPAVAAPSGAPYFICISTIEPRKNHLLLLNLWRALAADPARRRRGWCWSAGAAGRTRTPST